MSPSNNSKYANSVCADLRHGSPCRYEVGEEGECWYGYHPVKYMRNIACPFEDCEGECDYAHRDRLCPSLADGEACEGKCKFGHDASVLPCPDNIAGRTCRYVLYCDCAQNDSDSDKDEEEAKDVVHDPECEFSTAPKKIIEGTCPYDHCCTSLKKGETCKRYSAECGCYFDHPSDLAEELMCPIVTLGRMCTGKCNYKHIDGDSEEWERYGHIECYSSRIGKECRDGWECPYYHAGKCLCCNGDKDLFWRNFCDECIHDLGDHKLAKADVNNQCRCDDCTNESYKLKIGSKIVILCSCESCFKHLSDLDTLEASSENDQKCFRRDGKKRRSAHKSKSRRKREEVDMTEVVNPFDLLNME